MRPSTPIRTAVHVTAACHTYQEDALENLHRACAAKGTPRYESSAP